MDGPLTLMIPNLASACTRACMFLERNGLGNGKNQDEDFPEDFYNIIRSNPFLFLFSIVFYMVFHDSKRSKS